MSLRVLEAIPDYVRLTLDCFVPRNDDITLNKADKYFVPKLFAGEKKVLDIFHGKKNEDGTPLIIDKETVPTL